MSAKMINISGTGAQTALGKQNFENWVTFGISDGSITQVGLVFTVEASIDGTNYSQVAVIDNKTGQLITGGTSITPGNGAVYTWTFPLGTNYQTFRLNVSQLTSGNVNCTMIGSAVAGNGIFTSIAAAGGSFTNITASGTLGVTGATTLSSTLAVTGNVSVNTNKVVITASSGNIASAGSILSTSATGGVGYATGAGGAVAQITSRTTGVTINTPTGAITLVSAAGSATPFTMTVTNSSVAALDTVIVSQKSGTDAYSAVASAVAGGSFKITITDLTGTTTESPVFNFAVIKGVAS